MTKHVNFARINKYMMLNNSNALIVQKASRYSMVKDVLNAQQTTFIISKHYNVKNVLRTDFMIK